MSAIVLCAGISGHHHVAFLFRTDEFLGDVALDHFVREVPTQRVATESLDLKALLQHQTARLEADVHQPRAGEVGVCEYVLRHRLAILPRHVLFSK